jgi:hypothetical protein
MGNADGTYTPQGGRTASGRARPSTHGAPPALPVTAIGVATKTWSCGTRTGKSAVKASLPAGDDAVNCSSVPTISAAEDAQSACAQDMSEQFRPVQTIG